MMPACREQGDGVAQRPQAQHSAEAKAQCQQRRQDGGDHRGRAVHRPDPGDIATWAGSAAGVGSASGISQRSPPGKGMPISVPSGARASTVTPRRCRQRQSQCPAE